MTGRILHVSDLHTGTREDTRVEEALAVFVAEAAPDVVVASGDLAHRGRREELERAHRFLTGLGPPVIAVPGNHDLPYSVPGRFSAPWREFERVFGSTEPELTVGGIHLVGLNSARPWRHQGGALRHSQLGAATARLHTEQGFRVVVLHHHLIGAPWRAARKFPVSHRNAVLESLIAAGAELILSGHIHQAAVSQVREFAVVDDDARSTVVATAPGFGRPRPHRLGEARGFHLFDVSSETLTVRTHTWRSDAWELGAVRTFALGAKALEQPQA